MAPQYKEGDNVEYRPIGGKFVLSSRRGDAYYAPV
jgi:hypothetical protein